MTFKEGEITYMCVYSRLVKKDEKDTHFINPYMYPYMYIISILSELSCLSSVPCFSCTINATLYIQAISWYLGFDTATVLSIHPDVLHYIATELHPCEYSGHLPYRSKPSWWTQWMRMIHNGPAPYPHNLVQFQAVYTWQYTCQYTSSNNTLRLTRRNMSHRCKHTERRELLATTCSGSHTDIFYCVST